MPSYFQCLHCGIVTPIEASPPKCGTCGHGTGVVHSQKPESLEGDKGEQSKPTDPNEPAGMSGMLPALEGLATA
jgi:hypothetical protein